MLSVLQDLFDMVKMLFDFLWTMIEDLLSVINMLSKVVLTLPQWLEMFLPPGVAGLFIIAVSVTVIYRISARD